MDILSFTVIHLARSRQVSEFEKNSLFLPNLEMNGSRFVFSKWLVQLFLYGKEDSKTTKKGLEHFFSYMTNDLMFSFFIKSIIVIKVSLAFSNILGRVDFTLYPTHPAVPFISVITMS